ncbi:MAG: hypothetical protein RMJ37_05770 [Spirochaetia bacterium]|nr:hypothetical protein [Spirochaetota bacterium]MCX8097328.1 hypothetical protein [Spirochaetota bacterium]MDW8112823.1 hypothetical protein [Spirochaetia bacterium]
MKKFSLEDVKSLSSLEEIFSYIHRNNLYLSDKDVRELEDIVLKMDQRGKWCILLAEKFPDKVNIRRIEDAVIKKDKTGQFCYILAKNVPNVNIDKMREAVYKKDTSGIWRMKFDENVKK